jgi:hypothetical protein
MFSNINFIQIPHEQFLNDFGQNYDESFGGGSNSSSDLVTTSNRRDDSLKMTTCLYNLSATIDDIKRDPVRPVSEDATPIDDIFSSYSPPSHLSSLRDSFVLCGMDGQAPVYRDQSTGKVLDPKLVHKAMEEEFSYMRGLPVWKEYATLAELQKNHPDVDRGVIGTRWVLVNKGDDLRPDVRARLVAQEVKTDHSVAGHDPTLFSATPPLEAMRAIISKSASDPRKIIGQVDIKKAHSYGVSRKK